jgi:hypothetical protein
MVLTYESLITVMKVMENRQETMSGYSKAVVSSIIMTICLCACGSGSDSANRSQGGSAEIGQLKNVSLYSPALKSSRAVKIYTSTFAVDKKS